MPGDKLSTIYEINIMLNQLQQCMVKSQTLKRSLGTENFERILKICKDTEAIGEPTEKDLCSIRRDIETVMNISERLDCSTNLTATLYLERLLYSMQMKNSELGEVYNHIGYLYEFNNSRLSVRPAHLSQYGEERKSQRKTVIIPSKLPDDNKGSPHKKIMRRY